MRFAPVLTAFVLCLLEVQPVTSISLPEKRTPMGGFGYVHGYTEERNVEEAEFLQKRTPMGGFSYRDGYSNEDGEEVDEPSGMEKRYTQTAYFSSSADEVDVIDEAPVEERNS
ncbi:hypothetical protein DFH06DRAFT_1477235 [Mycena polygramma]|nr:hypothetical protein DFH06DRAFT_1477235 [Mycena polygramma]